MKLNLDIYKSNLLVACGNNYELALFEKDGKLYYQSMDAGQVLIIQGDLGEIDYELDDLRVFSKELKSAITTFKGVVDFDVRAAEVHITSDKLKTRLPIINAERFLKRDIPAFAYTLKLCLDDRKQIASLMKLSGADSITFNVKDNVLLVSSGKSELTINDVEKTDTEINTIVGSVFVKDALKLFDEEIISFNFQSDYPLKLFSDNCQAVVAPRIKQ